ncbi:MAG: hypothetical protein IT230_07755 [Flavobacteriales bacterium]|nr:hypothetical protein [Flavobacteriales bacterium]
MSSKAGNISLLAIWIGVFDDTARCVNSSKIPFSSKACLDISPPQGRSNGVESANNAFSRSPDVLLIHFTGMATMHVPRGDFPESPAITHFLASAFAFGGYRISAGMGYFHQI